jgi:hypothetical protein
VDALEDGARRVEGQDFGGLEAGDHELVADDDDVAQVAIEVEDAGGVAARGGQGDELAAGARDLQQVTRGLVGDAARLGAGGAPLGDGARRRRERDDRAAAAQRHVDAPGRVLDEPAGLVVGLQRGLVDQLGGGEIDGVETIAIGIGDDRELGVVGDEEVTARDGRSERRARDRRRRVDRRVDDDGSGPVVRGAAW